MLAIKVFVGTRQDTHLDQETEMIEQAMSVSSKKLSITRERHDVVAKLLSLLLTPIYLVIFFSIFTIFHPLLVLANFIGYRAFNFFFNLMCLTIITNFRLMGTKISVHFEEPLPTAHPIIVISNHQSMYDIPLLIWYFRKNHLKFISKKELGKWIPSISFALRHMGSVLIDRKDPASAIPAIEKFGEEIEQNKFAACIFPEGTRGRDGNLKRFKNGGFFALLKSAPSALVVPCVIENSWILLKHNLLPVPWGTELMLRVYKPIDPKTLSKEELFSAVETKIRTALNQP